MPLKMVLGLNPVTDYWGDTWGGVGMKLDDMLFHIGVFVGVFFGSWMTGELECMFVDVVMGAKISNCDWLLETFKWDVGGVGM